MIPDHNDFVKIISENERIIFKITTFYTNNKDDRKDLYQEIVLQLWKAFPNFRSEAKISTWIYKISLNTSVSQIRKVKKMDTVSISKTILSLSDTIDNELEERVKTLYEQISKLNDLEKALILLYLEEKNYEEIAEITGLTVTNVGTRLSRVKQKIKDQITNY